MTNLTIYGFRASTYVQTVLLECEEKKIDYDVKGVDFKLQSYRKLHPFARIPVLQEGGFTLYETLAIAVYLDETYPSPSLQPHDSHLKGLMFQWISSINSYFYEPFVRDYIQEFFLKETPDRDTINRALSKIIDSLSVVDHAISDREFLIGDSLTLADLFLAPIMLYFQRTPDGVRNICHHKNLSRWVSNISRRASCQSICSVNDLV